MGDCVRFSSSGFEDCGTENIPLLLNLRPFPLWKRHGGGFASRSDGRSTGTHGVTAADDVRLAAEPGDLGTSIPCPGFVHSPSRNDNRLRGDFGSRIEFRFSWLRGVDLNHRPLGYEPNELPDCSTPQFDFNNPLGSGQTSEKPSIYAVFVVFGAGFPRVRRRSVEAKARTAARGRHFGAREM